MNESVKSTIKAVIQTLDKVAVNGKSNLDMMLGCILALERAIQEEEEVKGDA